LNLVIGPITFPILEHEKTFLLDFFHKNLENSIALFGFAGYNLSTASILYSNKIPVITKTGSEKIGFRINKKEEWKSFNSIEKPSREEFEKEIEHLKKSLQAIFSDAKIFLLRNRRGYKGDRGNRVEIL